MMKKGIIVYFFTIFGVFFQFLWARIEVNPQSIRFGIVGISQTKEATVSIKNSGISSILISKIYMKKGDYFQAYFSQNYTLSVNQEVPFRISYSPQAQEWNSDEVIIEYIENDQVQYKNVQVEGAGIQSFFEKWDSPFNLFTGNDVSAYMLLSFPGKAGAPGKILKEALGEFDPSRWRAFIYDGQWKELSDDFEGNGYEAFFLINNQAGKRLALTNIITVKDTVYQVQLHKGWNLIRNPYSFPVSASNIVLESGGTPVFYGFQGTWKIEGVLYPWFGYAIYSENEDVLKIRGYAQLKSGVIYKAESDFTNKLVVKVAGFIDSLNFFGTGRDALQLKKPLFLNTPVKTYFVNSGNDQLGVCILSDCEEWTFKVVAESGQEVDLGFPALEEQALWYLIDEHGRKVKIRKGSHFVYTQLNPVHTFIIQKVTSEQPAAEKNTIGKIEIFPNPANPIVNIGFSLEKNAHVQIDIVNILGQVIRQLNDSVLPEGIHTLRWNGYNNAGNPSPSGIYLVRINIDNQVVVKKVFLHR